jgi:ribosomal protein L11 methyltransferase
MNLSMDAWQLDMLFSRAEERSIAAECLAGALEDLGALGWEETESAGDRKPLLRVFFPSTASPRTVVPAARAAARALRTEGILAALPRVATRSVEARDWVAECRRGFRGGLVAPGLRVVPPWRAERSMTRASKDDTKIIIEPGAAFGTGLHETTRLCLRQLTREIHGGERVADIGAGSGILSIAAVRLGARSAVAIEVDPEAHPNLTANIRLNRVGHRVRPFCGDAAAYAARLRRRTRPARVHTFDVIVCNMLPERMRPILGHFRDLVAPGSSATAILSGHLWHERGEVARALWAAGVQIVRHHKRADWGAIVGRIANPRP